MNDRQRLPETLDTVTVLTQVAQLYYEHFEGEEVRRDVEAAAERGGAAARHDALAEGAAAIVEEALGLFGLGGALMDDRLGAVHAAVFGWIERDTGGPEDEEDGEEGP